MASRSLGTLTLDLIARVGGFQQGMDQAARTSEQRMRQIRQSAENAGAAVGSALAGMSAAAIAAGTGAIYLLKHTAEATAETDKWAKSLGVSTQTLLQWQYAADRAGLSGDKIADIFKDLNDKIGDAALNKGGEAVDALNALGLSATKLAKLSPDQQLLAIANNLGKIGTTAEKTTVLESLGNDLSRMLPLLENGGAELQRLMQRSKELNLAPDQAQIDNLLKANEVFKDIDDQLESIKQQFLQGLATVDLSALDQAMGSLRETATDPRFVQGVTSIAAAVVDLTGKTASAVGAFADFAKWMGEAFAAKINGPALDDIPRLEDQVSSLNDELEKAKSLGGMPALFDDFGVSGSRAVADIQKDLELAKERLRIGQALQQLKVNPSKAPSYAAPGTPARPDLSGGNNGPAKAYTEAADVKLLDNLREQEAALKAQSVLIDGQTGKVVQLGQQAQALAKWEQQLADIKSKQTLTADQKVLLASADQITAQYRKNAALEKEVELRKKAVEEAAKLRAFTENLNAQLASEQADLATSVASVGMGSKAAQRFQEMANLRQQYQQQQDALLAQRNSGDITQELYEKETLALRDALDERLTMQEGYYQQLDTALGDWTNGAQSAYQDYLDSAADVAGQTHNLFSNAFSNAEDALVDFVKTGKLSFKDLADSIVSDLIRIQIRKALAGAIGAAAGSSNTYLAAVGSFLKQADGGAWMNGVQLFANGGAFTNGVVTKPTAFGMAGGMGVMGEAGPEAIMPLTRGADGSLGVKAMGALSGGSLQPLAASLGPSSISVPIQVMGTADEATLQRIRQAAEEGARAGYQLAVQDVKRNGPLMQMIRKQK